MTGDHPKSIDPAAIQRFKDAFAQGGGVATAGAGDAPDAETAQRRAAVEAARATAAARIASVEARDTNRVAAPELAALRRDRLVAAEGAAGMGDYGRALALLAEVEPGCVAIEELLGLAGEYDTLLAAADAALLALGDELAEAETARLRTEIVERARSLFTARDFAGAVELLRAASATIAAARAREAQKKEYEAALAAARQRLAGLTAESIATEVAALASELLEPAEELGARGDHARALALLARLEPRAAELQLEGEALAAYAAALARAEDEFKKLYQPVIRARVDELRARTIGVAKTHAAAGEWQLAIDALAPVAQEGARLFAIVERERAYQAARVAAEQALAAVTDPTLASDVAAIRTTLLDAARTAAEAEDFERATELLAQVGPRLEAARASAAKRAEYEATRAAATASLGELSDPDLAGEAARIRTELVDTAAAKASAGDLDGALVLLRQVAPATAKAKAGRAQRKEYDARLAALEAKLARFRHATLARKVAALRADALAKADAAAGAGNYVGAMTHLASAERTVVSLGALAERVVAFEAQLGATRAKLAAATHDVVAVAVGELKTKKIDVAVTEAAAERFPEATKLLDEASAAIPQLALRVKWYTAAEKRYTASYEQLERDAKSWTDWTAPDPLPGLSDGVPAIKTKHLDAAKAAATASKYEEAMAHFEAAKVAIGEANVLTGQLAKFQRPYLAGAQRWNAKKAVVDAFTMAPASVTSILPPIKTSLLEAPHTKMLTGDYLGAATMVAPLAGKLDEAEATIDRHQRFETLHGAADAQLSLVTDPLVAADVAHLRTTGLDAAEARMKAGDTAGAIVLLDPIVDTAQRIDAYGKAAKAAAAEVAKLSSPALATDKARIESVYVDAARARATARDYTGAKSLLERVAPAVLELLKIASEKEQADLARTGAQAGLDGDDKGRAVGAVEALLRALEVHPAKDDVQTEITELRAAITAAATEWDAGNVPAAKVALAAAADRCVAVRVEAARAGHYAASYAKAVAEKDALVDAFSAPDRTRIETDHLAKAKARADAGDYDAALAHLVPIHEEVEAAKLVAADNAKYVVEKPKADAELAKLTDAFNAPDKTRIDTDLVRKAATEAAARKPKVALELLARVAPAVAKALEELKGKKKFDPALVESERLYDEYRQRVGYASKNPISAKLVSAKLQADVARVKTDYIDEAKVHATKREFDAALKLLALADPISIAGEWDARSLYGAVLWLKDAQAEIAKLDGHPDKGVIAAELALLKSKVPDLQRLRDAKAYNQSMSTIASIFGDAKRLLKIADGYQDYAAKLASAEARITTCKAKVDGLPAPVPTITERFAAIRTELVNPAKTEGELHEFGRAKAELLKVDKACVEVEALCAQDDAYRAKLAAVVAKHAALSGAAIAVDKARIEGDRIEPAKARAATGDYDGALALLAAAEADCTAAEALATNAAAAEATRAAAQTSIDGADADAARAIADVRAMLDDLKKHPAKDRMKPRTDALDAKLAAVNPGDVPKLKVELTELARRCVELRVLADRGAAYEALLASSKAALAPLTQPLVATNVAAIRADFLDKAEARARAFDYPAALALLEKVAPAVKAVNEIVAADTDYRAKLAAAEALVAALTDPEFATGVADLRSKRIEPAKAKAAAPGRDYPEALKLLAKVASEVKAVKLRKAPTAAKFAEVMAEPGGHELLDEYVKGLPDNTKGEVLSMAMKARFNVDLELFKVDETTAKDATNVAKSAKRIYELMSKVPASHVQDNPSLLKIQNYGGRAGEGKNPERGSFYRGSEALVVLSAGRHGDPNEQPLKDVPTELPDVEAGCELRDDGAPPTYFSWTTLHELGHAIDDKRSVMGRVTGNAKYGGWKHHGADVAPAAAAAATKFDFDRSYLVSYLLGSKPAPPPPPSGTSAADWDAARKAAEEWCDAIRVDKELWKLGSESKKRAIGGRVFHEAYSGTWVSYDVGARSKGITGYQFRAPGEWFSELYAAAYSDKLKDSHPHLAWIKSL